MKLIVIIPAYNEELTIGSVIKGLRKKGYNDIIVVDDGSSDKTFEIASKEGVNVYKHMINRGLGGALNTGITGALREEADLLVTFDADGQHQVSDLLSMIEAIQKTRMDVILGSRFLSSLNNIPLHRRMILKMGVLFTNLTTGLKLTDTHNGLRVFNAQSLKNLKFCEFRMSHASEILEYIAIYHLSYKEHPVTITYASCSSRSTTGLYQDMIRSAHILFQFLVSKVIRT